MAWTDDQKTDCKADYIAGLSAAQIAKRINTKYGTVYSRNAVLGYCHRAGLTQKDSPVRQRPTAPAAKAIHRPVKRATDVFTPKAVPKAHRPPTPVITARNPDLVVVPFEQLKRGQCKWPIGDPALDGFGFCGVACEKTYCAEHARAGVNPKQPTRKSTESLTFFDGPKVRRAAPRARSDAW